MRFPVCRDRGSVFDKSQPTVRPPNGQGRAVRSKKPSKTLVPVACWSPVPRCPCRGRWTPSCCTRFSPATAVPVMAEQVDLRTEGMMTAG